MVFLCNKISYYLRLRNCIQDDIEGDLTKLAVKYNIVIKLFCLFFNKKFAIHIDDSCFLTIVYSIIVNLISTVENV